MKLKPTLAENHLLKAKRMLRDVDQALRHSEERFRMVFEEGPLGMALVDTDFRFVKVNRKLCDMLGYSEEELIALKFTDITHPEDNDEGVALARKIIEGELAYGDIDKRYIKKDGGVLWIHLTASIFRESAGGTFHGLAMIEDISARKAAESELRATEERYRTLVENASDAIVVLQEGKTVYRNQTWERLIGYSVDDTADNTFLDVVVPEDREKVRDYYRRRLQGESVPDQYELGILTRDIGHLTMEVKPCVIEYYGKAATLVVLRDVTKRKEMEQQLVHAQKMQAIGLLAGGIAHDFNNMLSAIMGYTHMASSRLTEEDNRVSKYLQGVQNASERASNLTRQLLTFSRQNITESRILNLNNIVIDTTKMLRRLIGEDIELVTLPGDDLWNVKADPGQIEQVLVNLAVNAHDAMPDGGKLTIQTTNLTLDEGTRLSPDALPGDYAVIVVTDTGVGMSEEINAHAFEPFFTTKEVGQGTGLGLSICYGIVTQNRGYITIDSVPGQGTTFKVYLPRNEESIDFISLEDGGENLPYGNETVFLVEDEPLVMNATAEVLREYGYSVLKAFNGVDALRIAQEYDEPIHLLLTDVVMPLMGGRELATRFQEIHPESRVIYTSGYVDDEALRLSVLEEMAEFMQKPFTPQDLTHKVRDILDKDIPTNLCG